MANIPEPLTRLEVLLATILYCVSNGEYGYVPEDPEPADDGDGDNENGGGDNENGGGE